VVTPTNLYVNSEAVIDPKIAIITPPSPLNLRGERGELREDTGQAAMTNIHNSMSLTYELFGNLAEE
jgi:hypothetical protein